MFDIIIVTHGSMGDGLVNAARLIMGNVDNIQVFNLLEGQNVNELSTLIVNTIESYDNSKEVLILTDLLSASPYNQSLIAVNKLHSTKQEKIHVLSGINLPMLLSSLNHQMLDDTLEGSVKSILEQSKSGIDYWATNIPVEEEDF